MSTQPPLPRQIDSWQTAEDNAVRWMRHWGINDARKTPDGADHGIDVRSRSALAQVKFEASQVGRQKVQLLVGARGHGQQQLFFFSGAGYAKTAIEYADVMNVALFKYDLLGRQSPVNCAARRVIRDSELRTQTTSTFAHVPVVQRMPRPTAAETSSRSRANIVGTAVVGAFLLALGIFMGIGISLDKTVEDRFSTAIVGFLFFGGTGAFMLHNGVAAYKRLAQ